MARTRQPEPVAQQERTILAHNRAGLGWNTTGGVLHDARRVIYILEVELLSSSYGEPGRLNVLMADRDLA